MRVSFDKRLFDVKPVLVQDERGFAAIVGESGADEIERRGRDIGDVLCGEDHVVVWLDAFFGKVRDCVADWEGGLFSRVMGEV